MSAALADLVAPPCDGDTAPDPSVPADVVLAACSRADAHASDISATLRAVAVVLPETAAVLAVQLDQLRRHVTELGTLAAGATT